MKKVFIFILFFACILTSNSNQKCDGNYNLLITAECFKSIKKNKYAIKNLRELKKSTNTDVHDFLDYQIITLLENSDDIEKNIIKFKTNYPNSHLIKKLEIYKARYLFNTKKTKELYKQLNLIKENFKLSKSDLLHTRYLMGHSLYKEKQYKKSFQILKDLAIKNPEFKSKIIKNIILDLKINQALKLTNKEKNIRLNNLYTKGMYSDFMNEFEESLSPQILIKKALINIKSNKSNQGLKMLKKIANGDFQTTRSQSQDLEAIAEAKYRLILYDLKTSNDNSFLAEQLNSILSNYPNYTKNNEIGYLSARLFTIDKEFNKAIKVYNWLIKTKSKDYLDKSFYGLAFSEYMLGNYKEAIGYFSLLKESNQKYYKQLGSYWKGKSLLKIKDKSLAFEEFNELVNKNKIGFYPYLASKIIRFKENRKPIIYENSNLKDQKGEIELLKLSKENPKLRKKVQTYVRNKISTKNFQSYLNQLYNASEYNLLIKISYNYNSNDKFKYPRGYSEIVKKYSKKYDVDSNLIFALIREESLYDPKAKSWVGAKGLMQLMDYTAKMLDKELKTKSSLFDPDDNINLGTYYLMKLMKRFDNNIPNVLAAYNGGPKNVELWRKKFNKLDDDEFIESIPFKETNGYVKRVLRSYYYYKNNN